MLRQIKPGNCTDPGSKIPLSILSNYSQLYTCSAKNHVTLLIAHRFAKGKANLLPKQVRMLIIKITDAGRNIVFHLDTGIHLQEIRLTTATDDPFPGPDIIILNMFSQLQGILNNTVKNLFCIKIVIETGRMETRGSLNPLLPSGGLNSTVAGAKMDAFIVTGTDQLHFEVIKVTQTLFNQYAAITELTLGIILHLSIDTAKMFNSVDLLNAHAAATSCRFDQYSWLGLILFFLQIKEMLGDFLGFHFIIDRSGRSWNSRNAQFIRNPLGIDLITEITDNLPTRTDKNKRPVTDRDPASETIIFREKTVSRMNRCTAGMIGYSQEIIRIGIARHPPRILISAVEPITLHMLRFTISISIDNRIFKAEILTGLHYADSYLSAISNQYFALHKQPLKTLSVFKKERTLQKCACILS